MPDVRDLSFGPPRWVWIALVLVAMGGLVGCASNHAKQGDFNAQFSAGKYSDAYEGSSKVASSLKAINRDQAALVAGLSARALGRNQDAKRWLTPLAINADAAMAGKSCVALGAIAQEEGRHKEASEYFTKAGNRLTGDDSAHALMCAGDSLQALHRPDQAATLYQQAKAKLVSDQQLRMEVGDRLAGHTPALASGPQPTSTPGTSRPASGRFTVQTGVFSTLQKAKSEAKRYQAKGSTKAVPITYRGGKTLYAVQVGRYASKQDADRVRKALGNGAIVAEVVD